MTTSDQFAVFILSHGRPDKVYTYKMLRECGYTGRVYVVIDNEDSRASEYYERFSDQVVMFDKAAIAKTFDEGDNFEERRTVVYARNACFEIAKELGLKYFIEMDDDYYLFGYRVDDDYCYLNSTSRMKVLDLDKIFGYLLDYYKTIPAKSLAVSQGGDYIGGAGNNFPNTITKRRKCMNVFVCSTDRPFKFLGRINEDVTTYTWYQGLGHLFLTFSPLVIQQKATQSQAGGMTEAYQASGTYVKSFYSVMWHPSAVSVRVMGGRHRIHHHVEWNNAVPCIIGEQFRKSRKRDGR